MWGVGGDGGDKGEGGIRFTEVNIASLAHVSLGGQGGGKIALNNSDTELIK